MGRTIVERAAQHDRVLLTLPNGVQCNYPNTVAMKIGRALMAISESPGWDGIHHYAIDDDPVATITSPPMKQARQVVRSAPVEPDGLLLLKYGTGARIPVDARYLSTVVEDRPAEYSQIPGADKPASRFVWHYFLVPRRSLDES